MDVIRSYELKRCPFCGGKARFCWEDADPLPGTYKWVQCTSCGSLTKKFLIKDHQETYEIADFWNNRFDSLTDKVSVLETRDDMFKVADKRRKAFLEEYALLEIEASTKHGVKPCPYFTENPPDNGYMRKIIHGSECHCHDISILPEILDCPICGCKPLVEFEDCRVRYNVKCTSCGYRRDSGLWDL